MPAVRDLLARKNAGVVSLPPTATVLEAASLMNEKGIGAMLVCENRRPVGIFTERDVLRRIVAVERAPSKVTLGEVMSTGIATCTRETDVEQCAAIMTERRIRHLPVVDDSGAVVGLVSIGDVVAHRVEEQSEKIEALNRYLYDVR
jgi:CBS domain-containing protein